MSEKTHALMETLRKCDVVVHSEIVCKISEFKLKLTKSMTVAERRTYVLLQVYKHFP
jgi:hypothetical protein